MGIEFNNLFSLENVDGDGKFTDVSGYRFPLSPCAIKSCTKGASLALEARDERLATELQFTPQ